LPITRARTMSPRSSSAPFAGANRHTPATRLKHSAP
jgi:hypothetical protein